MLNKLMSELSVLRAPGRASAAGVREGQAAVRADLARSTALAETAGAIRTSGVGYDVTDSDGRGAR